MNIQEHQIKYKEKNITYELIKSKIKNLYIYVKDGKVIIKAPIRMKDKQIQEFVEKKAKWIYQKLKQEREKKEEVIELEDIRRLEKMVQKGIEKYAKLLKETPNKVRIKDIKYAWGSCSSNRNITISMKLAKKQEKIIEYVILHEMCHLKYMNHSKEFWNLVGSYIPDYKKCRALLK